MQQKIIELGIDSSISNPITYLFEEKDNKIQILKKKLKILNTQNIQYPELVALQEERDQIYKEMLMYKEKVAWYKKDNSALEK